MRIYLGGFLDFYAPQKTRWLEVKLEEPSPLRDVLMKNGIPVAEIQLVVINGDLVELDTATVVDQDIVKVFPPVGGGYPSNP